MTLKRMLLAAVAVLAISCSQRPTPLSEPSENTAADNAEGDSAIYGLACDGCTDSILVLLPRDCSDPDTFDIIDARHSRRIMGHPHIGDEMAVVLNPEDHEEVLMAIDIDELMGQWCYMVEPTLRHIDQLSQRMQRRMMERMPDSVRSRLMVPREYGIRLKRGNTAHAIGMVRKQTITDDMSPVEYAEPPRYTSWQLYNGRLILKAEPVSVSGVTDSTATVHCDTADVVMLMRDSLILQFGDRQQSFYRKK